MLWSVSTLYLIYSIVFAALRYLSLTSSEQPEQVKAENSELTATAVYEVARPILQGCHAVPTR